MERKRSQRMQQLHEVRLDMEFFANSMHFDMYAVLGLKTQNLTIDQV